MIHSQDATKFVASFEGCRLKAYQDQGGIWTIGYGHTLEVKENDICTWASALAMLDTDLDAVDHDIQRLAPVPLMQNQYDALTSLIFNIGAGNFDHSTVLRELIAGNYAEAADAFLMWDKVAGSENKGLQRRRAAERLLFLKP